MKKDYTFDVFDTSSLTFLINDLKQLTNKLDNFSTYIIDKLLNYGLEVARENIDELGINNTGNLKSCLSVKKRGSQNVGYIYVYVPDDEGSNYAVYVEFGTGFEGSKKQHPKAGEKGYKYDINAHGEKGWYYPSKDGKMYLWTQGQGSRPFMYNTSQQLQKNVVRLVKEALEI